MLKIQEKVSLASYTTLKIGPLADFFAIVKKLADIQEAIIWSQQHNRPLWILGGGSNVLISKKIKGLVLKNELKGIEVIKKTDDYVLVEALSGELWSKLVNFTVERGFYGLENMFLIPGTVGAAPVQNIGAYGVELKDVFYHLRAIDLQTGHEKILAAKDCRFGYRDSVFKKKFKNKYFIYSVTVKLKRQPNFQLKYGSIQEKLIAKGITRPNVRDIVAVIQEIRNSKLPSPALVPIAGSFFKNPEVSKIKFNQLKKKYPQMPSFSVGRTKVKVPAGWLIEQAGFRGKKFGPVSVYKKQALILTTNGRATAPQVLAVVKKIKSTVKKKFGVALEEEVNII